jgi:hypothetical protein
MCAHWMNLALILLKTYCHKLEDAKQKQIDMTKYLKMTNYIYEGSERCWK